ncbi:hypothetical protein ACEQ8H_003950 [Pleosporales sp. CAS-2024a]
MAPNNLYLTYKKDTSRLLYWIINTSNEIVHSGKNLQDESVVENTTGRSTVTELVKMSRLIAQHLETIPVTVLRLFQSVIEARSTVHAAFQQILNEKPDPEIEKSNVTHKHFINALTEAFTALGGLSRGTERVPYTEEEHDDELFSRNHFAALSLGNAKEDEDEVSSEDNARTQTRVRKKRTGKFKKGKRGKTPKQKSSSGETIVLADVPMESYRIIEDKQGIVTEYLLAVYSVVQEWIELRMSIQSLWKEVAYDGLNGAVAASLTSTAVAMVKKTCIAVFAEFPGHESYSTIVQTITRGDPEKAQTRYSLSLYRLSDCGHQNEMVQERTLDAKEHFLVHSYNDLVAFITDFQKNRTGKPTRGMQAQLNSWSPTFNLERATNEDRVAWRRSYTINWLYDLVNIYSSIVVQRNTMKGEDHVYEDVDWSTTGPWHHHRRLFGLNEFAGEITTLAMQKPSSEVIRRIQPHHVFQLQCIVDSWTASRGWTLSPLRGHILVPPPRGFRARRDVDLFLDREVQGNGRGLLQSIDILKGLLEKDAELHEDPNRHTHHSMILEDIRFDFVNWLGESKYMYGLTTIPASRFSKYNANGLWEYSPLLCAAGLVEGLVLVQRVIMQLWDHLPEPTLALHLHNMLVKKGYLKRKVGLYATLGSLHEQSFFPEGIPTENFVNAMTRRVKQKRADAALLRERQEVSRDATKNIHHLLDPRFNQFFQSKSALMLYYDADGLPENIPDSEIKIPSMLYMIRLRNTEREIDPTTKETRLAQTELVRRCKAIGQSDLELLELANTMLDLSARNDDTDAVFHRMTHANDVRTTPKRNPYDVAKDKKRGDLQGRPLLDILRPDIFADVCGENPVSSINYALVTCHIMLLFMKFEGQFKARRHPLWVEAYERPPAIMRRHKRVGLITAAMAEADDEAMKIFAECFEELRMGLMGCIYWDSLRAEESELKGQSDDDDEPPTDQCVVM